MIDGDMEDYLEAVTINQEPGPIFLHSDAAAIGVTLRETLMNAGKRPMWQSWDSFGLTDISMRQQKSMGTKNRGVAKKQQEQILESLLI